MSSTRKQQRPRHAGQGRWGLPPRRHCATTQTGLTSGERGGRKARRDRWLLKPVTLLVLNSTVNDIADARPSTAARGATARALFRRRRATGTQKPRTMSDCSLLAGSFHVGRRPLRVVFPMPANCVPESTAQSFVCRCPFCLSYGQVQRRCSRRHGRNRDGAAVLRWPVGPAGHVRQLPLQRHAADQPVWRQCRPRACGPVDDTGKQRMATELTPLAR